MATEVTQFEARPEHFYPVAEVWPTSVVDAVHSVLSTIVEVDDLPFVDRVGFIGLQCHVNDLLAKSIPGCGKAACGLVAELGDAHEGVGDVTTLKLSCPLIKESSEAFAEIRENRCNRHHRRAAKWFGDWIQELAQSIDETKQKRAAAAQQLEAADDQLRDVLH